MKIIDRNNPVVLAASEKKSTQSHSKSGYELPPLDDILTDDESRKLILRRSNKPVKRSSVVSDDAPREVEQGAVLKTYIVEMRIEHVDGSEVDFDPALLIANLVSYGVRVVGVRLRGGIPVPAAAPLRVHRVGAPRKWNDDALAEASRALPPVLNDEQKRQRRRAQVAAASRRLRERRKFGGQGPED